ncbi:MAG: hypothetical protein E6Q62_08930 [Nitrosomonas sp.]|nr:MAG: hypothetical protein E6Q62_08930 [Nitrosomonas sp.]
MNTKKVFMLVGILASLILGGCVATPYYGNAGYYRSGVYGYGHQPYYRGQNYMGTYTRQPFIGGYIRFNGGHRHFFGGNRHGHNHGHFGWRGGHRGHRW